MAQPSERLQYMVRSPLRPSSAGSDSGGAGYSHVLSEADARLQEMEAQRILERVREHAKSHARKAWGAPVTVPDSVRRSLSRPLLAPTHTLAKEMTVGARADATEAVGLPPGTMLAPTRSRPASPAPATITTTAPAPTGGGGGAASSVCSPGIHMTPLRPRTAEAGRPASAASRRGMPAAPSAPISTTHVRKLEEEVAHLKETIDVLLHAGQAGEAARRPPPATRHGAKGGSRSHARPATVAAPLTSATRLDAVDREHAAAMAAVDATLDETKQAEQRIMNLEAMKRRLGATTSALHAATRLPHETGPPPPSSSAVDHGIESKSGEGEGEGEGEAGGQQAAARVEETDTTMTAAAPAAPHHHHHPPTASSRPASAPARSTAPATVTRAAPFHLRGDGDDKPMTIAARRAQEELRARQEAEQAMLHHRFKPKPIPASTRIPLFGQIMAQMEIRRKLKHEARYAELMSRLKPFAELTAHEEELKARKAAALARAELQLTRELAEGRKFHANPVPPTIQNPDSEYVALLDRERDRPARVAARARAVAAAASLPPRMALAAEEEKRRRREREARVRAEEAAERRRAAFHPNDLPDFTSLHATYEASMREKRRSFATTAVIPFGFDSEERVAADVGRRAARQREQLMATSRSLDLRAHLRSRSAGSGDEGGRGPTRPHSAGARPHAATQLGTTASSAFTLTGPGAAGRGSGTIPWAAASTAPPAAMTRTVQLRMLDTQRRVRQKQEAERAAALRDEEYARKVKEATRVVAPVVRRLEAERNPVPLSWQTHEVTNAATLAKAEFDRRAAANAAAQRARVKAAEARRPFLFLRSTIDVRREEARRAALIDAATAVGSPHHDHWPHVVQHGVMDVPVFDDLDRQAVGLPRHAATATPAADGVHMHDVGRGYGGAGAPA